MNDKYTTYSNYDIDYSYSNLIDDINEYYNSNYDINYSYSNLIDDINEYYNKYYKIDTSKVYPTKAELKRKLRNERIDLILNSK